MLRHFKIMSRHITKLKGKNIFHEKEILCHDIFQEQQGMKSWLQQCFYVATQETHVATITRQLK